MAGVALLAATALRMRQQARSADRAGKRAAVEARRNFYRTTFPAVDVRFLGDKELDKAFRRIDVALQKKLIRQATREAARQIVLPEARARVDVEEGELRGSIRVRAKRNKRRGRGRGGTRYVGTSVVAGVGLEDSGRASFHELGTSRQEARPFLRPALDEKRAQVKELLAKRLGRGIRAAGKTTSKR